MSKRASRRRKEEKRKKSQTTHNPPKSELAPAENKKNHWTGQLSIGIGLLGLLGLLTLIPQMGVVPGGETENSQPFSAPFRIHNAGILPFYLKRAFCFESDLKNEITEKGSGKMTNVSTGVDLNRWLGSGHDAAVMCGFHILPRVTNADMTIVVDYSPWGLSRFFTSREHFRFTGVYVDNWQWIEVDPTPTEKQVDDQIRTGDEALKYLDQLHKSKK